MIITHWDITIVKVGSLVPILSIWGDITIVKVGSLVPSLSIWGDITIVKVGMRGHHHCQGRYGGTSLLSR